MVKAVAVELEEDTPDEPISYNTAARLLVEWLARQQCARNGTLHSARAAYALEKRRNW